MLTVVISIRQVYISSLFFTLMYKTGENSLIYYTLNFYSKAKSVKENIISTAGIFSEIQTLGSRIESSHHLLVGFLPLLNESILAQFLGFSGWQTDVTLKFQFLSLGIHVSVCCISPEDLRTPKEIYTHLLVNKRRTAEKDKPMLLPDDQARQQEIIQLKLNCFGSNSTKETSTEPSIKGQPTKSCVCICGMGVGE